MAACKTGCKEEVASINKAIGALLTYRRNMIDRLKKDRPGDVPNLLHPRKIKGSYVNLAVTYFDFPTWLYRFDDKNSRGWTVNTNSYIYQRDKHFDDVSSLLGEFRGKFTGTALRNAILAAQNELLILPFFNFNLYPVLPWRPLGFNSTASSGHDDPDIIGSDAVIMFSAHMWTRKGEPGTSGISGPGSEADEVLFHELVHGLRNMAGVIATQNKLDNNFENEEEFIAVVLSNIYLAEKGRKFLRADHAGFEPMSHPERFLNEPQNKRLLLKFKGEQRPFFDELSKIPAQKAWWNPLSAI